LKVCQGHIKESGIKKRNLEIVSIEDCELCKLEGYFNDPKNPARKTEKEIVEMLRERRLRSGASNA